MNTKFSPTVLQEFQRSETPFNEGEVELRREGVYAGCEVGDSQLITLSHNFNGSGPKAFGGARKWPVVKLKLHLREGDYAKADELALKLQLWLKENV